jgi:hypothetical protein
LILLNLAERPEASNILVSAEVAAEVLRVLTGDVAGEELV